MAAAGGDGFFELREMFVEVGERGVFDRPRSLANQIGVWQGGPGFAVATAERVAELAEDLLQVSVGQCFARSGEELVMGFAQVVGHCSRFRMINSTIGAIPISTAPTVIGGGGGDFRTR